MKRRVAIIGLLIVCFVALGQENGVTLKPNYRKIARVVKSPSSPYFLDSLEARFFRCDTAMTVDDLRCLYYGDTLYSLVNAAAIYDRRCRRFGRDSRQANDAWWQYQMLVTAIWSTGDGSRRRPLHVACPEDARLASEGYDSALWFKMKGKRKFCVSPQR